MGFANSRRAQDDHVVAAFDEAQPGQLAHLPAVQAGLEVEIELVEGLDPREARLAQPGFDAALVASLPFGVRAPGSGRFCNLPGVGQPVHRPHPAGLPGDPSSACRAEWFSSIGSPPHRPARGAVPPERRLSTGRHDAQARSPSLPGRCAADG